MNKLTLGLILALFLSTNLYAQDAENEALNSENLNWYNKDLKEDNIVGISTEKLYKKVLVNMKPKKKIIVAVIDSGVDIDHEDLKEKIWTNEDEIPNNNIDDDNNGYVDDVHGWNFLGNKKGEHVDHENLEYTRVLKLKDPKHPDYKRSKELYDSEVPEAEQQLAMMENLSNAWMGGHMFIKERLNIEVTNLEDLRKIESKNDTIVELVNMLKQFYTMGLDAKQIEEGRKHFDETLKYSTNMEFDGRSLVGDDPTDIRDTDYGNPDVKGPGHAHGTSVSGAIAAVRNNKIGINGVADFVEILPVRAVPMGDEYDKDIALAIRYAVDNGADIINMSFGKDISPNKKFVDDAVRYAEKKGVLLVHGCGNDGNNLDKEGNFPTDQYLDKTYATNFLSIGANSQKTDEHLAADFSNYGKKKVDLFAPGVDLVSLDWGSKYSSQSGTSLAAPVVSGMAAVILAYYPDLSPKQVIDILIKTAQHIDSPKKVILPGTSEDKVKFEDLSISGGVANLYDAFMEAGRISKK